MSFSEYDLATAIRENMEKFEFFKEKRQECHEHRVQANYQGRHSDEMHYLSEFYRFNQLMEEINRKSGDEGFKFNNQHCAKNEIDLHFLSISEAILKLHQKLTEIVAHNTRAQTVDREMNYNNHGDTIIKDLKVIVGKGLHSTAGAKIKPAVESFGRNNSFQYIMDTPNPGCITFVDLDSLTLPSAQSPNSSHSMSHLQHVEHLPISSDTCYYSY